jgi:protein-S-isoprenylcysteine O-methyltransferase Ste14
MHDLKKIYDVRTREGRKDLAGEHPSNDLIQVSLLLIFLTVWIIDSFWLNLTTFPARYVSLWIWTPVGGLLLICWFFLTWIGLDIIFGQEREVPRVVREGPFNYIRHPIYLASILFYFGLTLMTLSLASLLLCLIITLYYNFAANYEEKLLLEKFGDDYKKYMTDVPKWLPKIKF